MKNGILLGGLIFLNACSFVGTAYNVGSKVGAVVLDERSLKDDWNDTQVNIQIRSELMAIKPTYALDIEITVFEGEVMLNGALRVAAAQCDKSLQPHPRPKSVRYFCDLRRCVDCQ